MDPFTALGAGASIVTLVQLASETAALSIKFARRFHYAFHDISQISNKLPRIAYALELLSKIEAEFSQGQLLEAPEITRLSQALDETKTTILNIQNAIQEKVHYKGKMARLKWAFQDKEKVEQWSTELQQCESSLGTVLQLLDLRYISLACRQIASLKSDAKGTQQLVEENFTSLKSHVVDTYLSLSENISSWEIGTTDIKKAISQHKTSSSSCLKGEEPGVSRQKNPLVRSRMCYSTIQPQEQRRWTMLFGIDYCISKFANTQQTNMNISFRSWWPNFLRSQIVSLDYRLYHFARCGIFNLSYLGGEGLIIKNVIPEDSEIILACKSGNVLAVQELLIEQKANPTDVTPANFTPLKYSIENGWKEVVEVLVIAGANVNSSFGVNQTSPLELAFAARQVDIARYLIEQGADVDYISARGWTAANNLYRTGVPKAQATAQEFLEMLGSSSFSEIDFQDATGWSFMHLVAAYGNANDVKTAIRFGASTTLPIKTSLWIPIFCAAQFKNQETFKELAKYTGSAVATMADLRGWTLLHVAASTGNAKIIRMLLELGADVDVKTKAANLYVPEAMRGRCCTPEEVAQICGPEAHTTFLQTVKDFLPRVPEVVGENEVRGAMQSVSNA